MFIKSSIFKKLLNGEKLRIIDVGARGGIQQKYLQIKKHIEVIAFEPDTDECIKLNNEKKEYKINYFPCALYSSRKANLNLYLNKVRATSSLYCPNTSFVKRFEYGNHYELEKVIKIKTDTLDNIILLNQFKDVDFIKLDTQGSELDILIGAEKTLGLGTVGIDIEVEFSKLYKNQPLFCDVDRFLKNNGFFLFDIKLARLKRQEYNLIGTKGQVLWGHATYLRDYVANSNNINNLDLVKIVKIIAISELNGFTDYSLELVDLFLKNGLLDGNTAKAISSEIRKRARINYCISMLTQSVFYKLGKRIL